jgi:hypothetical protein
MFSVRVSFLEHFRGTVYILIVAIFLLDISQVSNEPLFKFFIAREPIFSSIWFSQSRRLVSSLSDRSDQIKSPLIMVRPQER